MSAFHPTATEHAVLCRLRAISDMANAWGELAGELAIRTHFADGRRFAPTLHLGGCKSPAPKILPVRYA